MPCQVVTLQGIETKTHLGFQVGQVLLLLPQKNLEAEVIIPSRRAVHGRLHCQCRMQCFDT
jgi:hypothetical protein